MKTIKLEEIFFSINRHKPHPNTINAMKEACKQALELAAENAKTRDEIV